MSPVTLTTPITVATLVLAPLIQVSLLPSVVPVLPIIGTFGEVAEFDARPEPSVITFCMAYVMPASTSGVTAWVHLVCGGVMSTPSPPTIRSITIGLQLTPLLAMPAKAMAMLSGATSFVPSTAEGPCSRGFRSARPTPKELAIVAMPHWSSFFAMPMKPVLMESIVDCSAL